MSEIIILKDLGEGLFLGADDTGALYDGKIHTVGHDELTVETTLTDSGFDRVTSYMGQVHSKGNMDKASFDLARVRRHRDNQEDRGYDPEADPEAHAAAEAAFQASLDAEWEAEVSQGAHQKSYQPGTGAENLLNFFIWTPRKAI